MPEWKGKIVRFDASQIRPKGAPITGGFKAPGPEPLMQSLERIRTLLDGLLMARTLCALLIPTTLLCTSQMPFCQVVCAVLL
jgi:hypothetical protein